MPLFERATFGNKGGSHQLLSTSIATGTPALDQLRFLVDRPAGHVDSSVTWSPYWGCQPVDDYWVLWRGEEDFEAPRRNMVKVEVALLSISRCALLDDLDELLAAVGHTGDDRSLDDALKLSSSIIDRLSTAGPPVALPDIAWAPSLVRTLWPRLWPSARASLSLRTFFAAEYISTTSPPVIAVFPAELKPRWRGQPFLEGLGPAGGPASHWFGGDVSPLFQRLLHANSERLPGEFSVLVRVDRIVERLERLHRGEGTVSDALVVARTQEAFPAGFNLPPEDLEAMGKSLVQIWKGKVEDIRAASLTQLGRVTNQSEIESALGVWIQTRLPEATDQDALWILQHCFSQDHALWWRNGVCRGLAAAFGQRCPRWATALWRWWTRMPAAIEWVKGFLDDSAEVESWLAKKTPKEIQDDLLNKLVEVCREYNWAILLARTLGSTRQLAECIDTMRENLRSPEDGMEALLTDRDDTEIIIAAGTANWLPLIVRAAEITRTRPGLFGHVSGTPGLIPLLATHLKIGGVFPSDLVRSDFLATVFEGMLQHDEQFENIAGFLGASAGASALDHPFADQLLGELNVNVVSGAAEEWWARFLANDRVGAPPTSIRSAVLDSARVRCQGASVTLIIRLLELLPEISEEMFIEWMKHTGFFWDDGDHQRVATLLHDRNWRLATRTFRHSWKRELQAVAWYARDLLSVFDGFWWPPSLIGATGVTAPTTSNFPRRTMKITFLASNPIPSCRLALDEEARLIAEKVRDARHRDLVTFRTRWAVRPGDLQQALLEDEPMVVHFSGHGGGAVGIVLHSQDQSEERLVAEDALAGLFRALKDNIRVVVLNACYSEVQAKAIVKEIDFVIGMSDSVGDEAARVFAAAFYRALAFGRSVQSAFDLGLNDLGLLGLGQEDHIPQLLVRPGVDPSTTVLVGPSS